MGIIEVGGRTFTVSRATRMDVAEIAALLADDVLVRSRESEELAP